tara:strand:- start:181 stop:1062 length:882 start_codon:yes stop_codon:yes gene_type:complete
MTMTKIILGLLIVATSLISCESQKEEDVKVSLTYSHEQSRQKSIRSPIVISKHTIDVADYDYKNIYDSTELDQSMTGTVMVPVDVNLEVQYKNYTLEEPKIHYESGFSDPFVVTHSSPPTTTVTIPVSVNTDHPSQVVEEEVVDNETILIETQILSWSDNFTKGQVPNLIQEQTYKDFWDNASSQTWDNISIGNPDNMTTCTNSTFINDFLRNKDNASFEVYGLYCDGMYWTIGKCGWGLELSAFDRQRRDCACLKSTDIGYTIRPLIGNKNWGGVGKSCDANSQTLQVILQK